MRGLLHIVKRQQLAAQRVFQREQAGFRKMRVVGLDRRFNVGEQQSAVILVVQRLRLHAAQYCRAAAFPAVAVRHLADDVFVAALAMTQDGAEIALRARRHKQRRFKTEHIGDFFLQRVDAGVIAKHVVAQWRGQHGGAHGRRGLRDGVTPQINDLMSHLCL